MDRLCNFFNKQRMKKNIRVIGVLTLICTVLVSNVFFVSAGELEEAEKKQQQLQNSLSGAKKLVNNLQSSKKSTEQKIMALDNEMARLEKEDKRLNEELGVLDEQIASSEKSLEEAEDALSLQKEQMAERIVYTYENGRTNYLEMIFEAKDMASLLNMVEYVYQVTNYDRQQLEAYHENVVAVDKMHLQLENDKKSAKEMSAEIDQKQKAAKVLSEAKEQELNGITEDLVDAKALEEQYRQEVAAQNAILAQIQAAIAAQNTNAGAEGSAGDGSQNVQPQAPSGNTSGFLWPCPASTRITSNYGPRTSPTAGASSYHKGIDIGAPNGSAIIAAQGGTVLVSAYSASAGNYLIVNHGKNANGVTICTVYMHCSKLNVSAGQTVSKGQTIALVGSTGISTGPHLHFGVTENGNYVNPRGYV